MDESANAFSIYPNPVSNALTIANLDHWSASTLSILSMDGQIIESLFIPNTKQLTLDVSSFPSGVYMMRLSSQDGKMEMNKRFVVMR